MPKKKDIPAMVEDFAVLPVTYPILPSFPYPASHYFYVRAHKPKQVDELTPRSIFIANIPIDANDALLKHLLGEQLGLPAGRIQEVRFLDAHGKPEIGQVDETTPEGLYAQTDASLGQKRKRTKDLEEQAEAPINIHLPAVWDRTVHAAGTNAIVVFVDRASRDAVLKTVKTVVPSGKKITWGEGLRKSLPSLGVERYQKHLNLRYPPREQLLQTVNAYMTAFNEREEAQAELAARKRQEPDEDGFVTVSRGGRLGAAKPEQAARRLEREKERTKGYNDFYRFQFRENRKERQAELLRKFAEDQARIKEMRARRRKFKLG